MIGNDYVRVLINSAACLVDGCWPATVSFGHRASLSAGTSLLKTSASRAPIPPLQVRQQYHDHQAGNTRPRRDHKTGRAQFCGHSLPLAHLYQSPLGLRTPRMIQLRRIDAGNADLRTINDDCVAIYNPALPSERSFDWWDGWRRWQSNHNDRRRSRVGVSGPTPCPAHQKSKQDPKHSAPPAHIAGRMTQYLSNHNYRQRISGDADRVDGRAAGCAAVPQCGWQVSCGCRPF